MSSVNRTDFNEYNNRCAIGEELMKQDLKELGLLFIRLVTYMEYGNHADRQTFWEYLEKICQEKRQGQMVLDQLDTQTQNETVTEAIKETLDRHLNKV